MFYMKGVLHVDSVVAPCSSSLLVLLRVIVVTYDRKNRCNQLHQMAYRLPAYVIVFFFLHCAACVRWYQLLAQTRVRGVAQSHVVRFEPSSIMMR
jgi:hypothetical protein